MASVQDRVGRVYKFDQIRYKMDEELLQQASQEVTVQTSERGQFLFDRYCTLHFAKYGRNYEPTHFSRGKLLPRFSALYDAKVPTIHIAIEVRSGPLFDRFIGQPADYVESAIRSDPRGWINAGTLVVTSA